MGLYEVPLSMSGCGMRTMLAKFHMCGIMLLLKVVLHMLVRNASPRGPMCFSCPMFRFSGRVSVLQSYRWGVGGGLGPGSGRVVLSV